MTTTATAHSTDARRTLAAIKLVADCIREAGEIPSGHLYALLMGHGCTLAQYESIIGILTASTDDTPALVGLRGHLLTWQG